MHNQKRFCPTCQNRYSEKHHKCPECDVLLTRSPDINQNVSHHSNAVLINGENKAPITIHAPPEKSKPDTTIHRESITPITIGSTPVKAGWAMITGGLGIAGSIADSLVSLINLLEMGFANKVKEPLFDPIAMILLLGFSISLFGFGFILHRARYTRLLWTTVEIDKNGNLYKTKVAGTCGLCHHSVRLSARGPKERRKTVVECTHNPAQHLWEFDPTILGDVGEDYLRSYKQKPMLQQRWMD